MPYCNYCGKKYSDAKKPKYCSDECSVKAEQEKQRERYGKRKNLHYTAYLKTRFNIFQKNNFTCQYCGRKAPFVEIVIDHIVPVNKGGKTEEPNLITSCAECNLGKGDVLLKERSLLKK